MILFWEDEKMFNLSYLEALEEAGYNVDFEKSILGGLEFFKQHLEEIELVILDIMFSPVVVPAGMDESKIMGGRRVGEELLRLIDKVPGGNRIPKIILTNVVAQEFHNRYASSNQVRKCLRKRDVLPSQLVSAVQEILEK